MDASAGGAAVLDSALAYIRKVGWDLLVPHVCAVLAFYAYCYRDYRRDLAVEQAADSAAKKDGEEARVRVWTQAKHEHSYPLYKEAGGVRGAYGRIIRQVLWIDWVVTPIVALCWGWLREALPPLSSSWDSSAPAVSIGLIAARIIASGLFYEGALTLIHVFLHRPGVYAYAHKMHHGGPQCALAGTYMTATETALNGAGLSFVGVALLGFPTWLVCLTAILGRVNLGRVHSGWRALDAHGPKEAAFHGVHHSQGARRDSNFGFVQWMDKAMGTFVDPRAVFAESYTGVGVNGKAQKQS